MVAALVLGVVVLEPQAAMATTMTSASSNASAFFIAFFLHKIHFLVSPGWLHRDYIVSDTDFFHSHFSSRIFSKNFAASKKRAVFLCKKP